MRFRSKLGDFVWGTVLFAFFNLVLMSWDWKIGFRAKNLPMALVGVAIAAAAEVSKLYFDYWELEYDTLRHRNLWKKTEINSRDVTRICSTGFSSPASVKIVYRCSKYDSGFGSLLADPADLDGFLVALRQYVPQAKFEI
jgi:hypothetical protein